MTSQVVIVAKLLIGAVSETEAAASLAVPVAEIERLKRLFTNEETALVPIAVDLRTQRFEFLDLRDATFREPFFSDTIDHVRVDKPTSLNFEVHFDDFERAVKQYQRVPDGFIFHVGRCGSTLLCNMLSESSQYLLMKEPELVNELLAALCRSPDENSRAKIEDLLAATIRYLLGSTGRIRAANYRVLKFAAWNVCLAHIIIRLFSVTPAVFVYRSPLETVASLLFQPPQWFDLIERPRFIQSSFFPTMREVPAETQMSPTTLFAHAWRSAADAALALPSERLCLIEYGELVRDAKDVIRRVLRHFGHNVDPSSLEAMAATRAIYAKDPFGRVSFNPQGEHHRPALSRTQVAEVQTITADTWSRLEARAKQDRR